MPLRSRAKICDGNGKALIAWHLLWVLKKKRTLASFLHRICGW